MRGLCYKNNSNDEKADFWNMPTWTKVYGRWKLLIKHMQSTLQRILPSPLRSKALIYHIMKFFRGKKNCDLFKGKLAFVQNADWPYCLAVWETLEVQSVIATLGRIRPILPVLQGLWALCGQLWPILWFWHVKH